MTSHICLCSPPVEHHCILARTHFPVPPKVGNWFGLGGWLHSSISHSFLQGVIFNPKLNCVWTVIQYFQFSTADISDKNCTVFGTTSLIQVKKSSKPQTCTVLHYSTQKCMFKKILRSNDTIKHTGPRWWRLDGLNQWADTRKTRQSHEKYKEYTECICPYLTATYQSLQKMVPAHAHNTILHNALIFTDGTWKTEYLPMTH